MPGLGIVLNPHSRSNLKNPQRIKRLGFIVGDKGSCHATHDILDVENLAKEFMERDIEVLGISGGDGTNHVTLTTFLKVYGEKPLPKIAFLRGGTMNNLANVIGVKGSPEKILSNLIFKYHEGVPFETTEVDMINVNGKYGFLFGMGVVSNFIDDYNNIDSKPSAARGAWLLGKAVLSAMFHGKYATKLAERFNAVITLDGRKIPFKNYTIIIAGTLQTLGFNFRVLYRSREIPGQFQFVGVSSTPRHLLFAMPSALMARPMKSDNCCDEVGSSMTIELDHEMPYQIDGDAQPHASKIEISMGPRITCVIS